MPQPTAGGLTVVRLILDLQLVPGLHSPVSPASLSRSHAAAASPPLASLSRPHPESAQLCFVAVASAAECLTPTQLLDCSVLSLPLLHTCAQIQARPCPAFLYAAALFVSLKRASVRLPDGENSGCPLPVTQAINSYRSKASATNYLEAGCSVLQARPGCRPCLNSWRIPCLARLVPLREFRHAEALRW